MAAACPVTEALGRLGTDRLDLYQLHSVGKLDALVRARDEGLVRWLVITGHMHDAPRVHLEALTRIDYFTTVMFPLNFVLWSIPEYRRDAVALLEECQQRDVGVHILKTVAKDPWGDRPKTHATWYEPFADQETIDRAVAFVLSQPVTTLCSVGDVNVLPRVLEAAERYHPLDDGAQRELVATADRYHSPFVGEWA